MADWIAFSVDLEPNKDGSLDGVTDAMEWFDRTVPKGTVYATHRIATELPELITDLAADHEIGVHVHPREFGHQNDQLAALSTDRQRELIAETRAVLAEVTEINQEDIAAFRAGRHSASETTLAVLSELGFTIDASVNVRYTAELPKTVTARAQPFSMDTGLFELPTTYARPPLVSRVGLRLFPNRELTATANTLRTDRRGCTGLQAMSWLRTEVEGLSMYMHPYDATEYHVELDNNGAEFRARTESLLAETDESMFRTATEVRRLHQQAKARHDGHEIR
jgi:hypothetical protein